MGISPGTKAIGIVILNDGMLDLWSIHIGNDAALAAAASLMDKYNVTDIAVLKGHTHTGYPRQKQLVADVKSLAAAEKVRVQSYSTYDIRRLIPDNPKNKTILFGRLTETFPELSAHYHKYRRERNAYWSKLFEAVACAYINTL